MSKLRCELVSSPVSYIWNVLEWNISRTSQYCPCCPHGCRDYTRAQSVVFTVPGLSCKDVSISTAFRLLWTQYMLPWLLLLTPALLQFTSFTLSLNEKIQPDVTFCILYFSSNSCLTCFGQPCAYHQELATA